MRTLKYDEFLEVMKKYPHIRIGVGGGVYPFEYTYFKVDNKDLADTVTSYQMDVTFDVMTNPHIPDDIGVMYVQELNMKLLDNDTE